MSLPPSNLFYEFGPFRLDIREHRLLRDGEVVALTPKAVDTLKVLIEHRGQLVERNELMKSVWGEVSVEDGNLSVTVSMLRKVLGDQNVIETIPKRGYKFVAEARELVEDIPALVVEKKTTGKIVVDEHVALETRNIGSTLVRLLGHSRTRLVALVLSVAAVLLAICIFTLVPRNSARTGNAPKITSIAVLPFKTIDTQDDSHEGLGLADLLITRLSNVKQLTVRPTSTVISFENSQTDSIILGKQLQVDAVLEGSIFKSKDKIRITARLIRLSDQKPLWSGQFEKLNADRVRIQDEIAAQVVDALALHLSNTEESALTRRYTENVDAYELYLRGRYEWNKRDNTGLARAQFLFRSAIEKDPNFALAYVGLADSLIFFPQSAEMFSAISRAMELDPNLGEAYATDGFICAIHQWKWGDAENSFKKSIELNPGYATAHHWYAVLLGIEGRNEEAKAEMNRALEINPLSYNFLADMGRLHLFKHEYNEAKEFCKRALEVNPDFLFGHECLQDVSLQTGEYEAYINELLISGYAVVKGSSHNPNTLEESRRRQLEEMRADLRSGGIRQVITSMIRDAERTSDINPNRFYARAWLNAFLGNKEKALDELEQALQEKAFLMPWVKSDPRFDALRTDQRFRSILQKMNLPPDV